ncbi:hypothetical protein BDN71DRAFT_1444333 [Pleurotus eryngii]|uniref:Uncharacterized protein n=1 Tax=Pleurotus eryngii TaxID=5323 RepID=A0A9P6A2X6_PLEER|nr:hypothetical protein BDN71DRAFT_1444333 [Pleurotus eryngii]
MTRLRQSSTVVGNASGLVGANGSRQPSSSTKPSSTSEGSATAGDTCQVFSARNDIWAHPPNFHHCPSPQVSAHHRAYIAPTSLLPLTGPIVVTIRNAANIALALVKAHRHTIAHGCSTPQRPPGHSLPHVLISRRLYIRHPCLMLDRRAMEWKMRGRQMPYVAPVDWGF